LKPKRDYGYVSSLSPYIKGLIDEKRSAGYAYNSASDVLKELDTFCAVNGFYCKTVTKELADAWSVQKETEGLSARNIRVSILRQVSKYILSLGIQAYLTRTGQSTESPEAHVFTECERAAFFESLDVLTPSNGHGGVRILNECRVLFRFYYCCGMRLSELLGLTWDCFDPEAGTLRILHSKGDKDRFVWITEDVTGMLLEYRAYIQKEIPGTALAFPGMKPRKSVDAVTVRSYFIKAWGRTHYAGGSNPPTIKSFRHTFVVERLNIWMSEEADIMEKLPYLSNFLGHSSMRESLYYYHQIEESRRIIRSKDKTSKKVIPEVKSNEEQQK